MTWQELTRDDSLINRAVEMIKPSADHYAEFSKSDIDDIFDRKRGKAYFYDDGTTEIFLAFQYNTTYDIWRIKHGVYSGGDAQEAMKITFRKIRKFMDDNSLLETYILLGDPEIYDNNTKTYLQFIQTNVWEYSKESARDGLQRWNIRRDPDRKSEDEDWKIRV